MSGGNIIVGICCMYAPKPKRRGWRRGRKACGVGAPKGFSDT